MFEAEYARRRTTAEAEAGRICSGDTVYLAGGRCSQWTLPPPSTGGRRSSTGYGCSTTCPWSPWLCLPTPPAGTPFK